MNFSVRISDHRPCFDLYQFIYATGDIVSGDAELLARIIEDNHIIPGGHFYIDSGGGDLSEGMKIGRLLNKYKFNTYVGNNKNDGSIPVCASAAAIAYMGGYYRKHHQDCLFGLHQFSIENKTLSSNTALSLGQEISAEIIKYLNENLISTEIFSFFVSAKNDDINWIDTDTLRKTNVINDGIRHESWTYEVITGAVTLSGVQDGERGQHIITFATSGDSQIHCKVLFGTNYPSETIEEADAICLRIDKEVFEINVSDIIEKPFTFQETHVGYSMNVSNSLFDRIRNASDIGACTQPKNRELYAGFDISTNNHKDKMLSFFSFAETTKLLT